MPRTYRRSIKKRFSSGLIRGGDRKRPLVRRSWLGDLYEYAAGRVGVDEEDPGAVSPRLRRLVDNPDPSLGQSLELRIGIVDLEADMLKSGSSLLQELGDGGVR